LNLFSAVCGGAAAGILTAVVALVGGSASAGAAAGLLLAFSHTFWTQSIIAEVYSLHLALVGCCLAALLAWSRRQTATRLGVFFGAYALAFGNHLSMILLLVPFAAFILLAAERRADVLKPRIVLVAAAIAAIGALQYLPEFLALWSSVDAPERWTERLAAFWFDVTKSDWRESMVLGVRSSQMSDRLSMFAFDARQQFGVAGLALAAAGLIALWRTSRPWAVMVALAYAINTAFAITYNVGDPHVFFLPGHYFTAFAAGAAVAAVSSARRGRRALAAAAIASAVAYAGWRAYDTWPAVDRHFDRRPEMLVTRLTAGLDERTALLAAHLNWQVENALLYETRYKLRGVAWTRLHDVLLHFPLIVRDNVAAGRDVVLTSDAVSVVSAAFGTLFPIVPDPVPPVPSLLAYASRIPAGAPYALTVLEPSRNDSLDRNELAAAVASLTGGRARLVGTAPYEVLVGRAGHAPLIHRVEARPFRMHAVMPEGQVEIRLDGWVPLETFRRAGFGRVLLDRRPVLTIERGVSLAALDASEAFYGAGVFARQPRFRIPAAGAPRLALLH
jgi:hypothetical protein